MDALWLSDGKGRLAPPAATTVLALCSGQAEEGCDELPRVSTCFWKLTLPACRSMNVLRSRLLTAIQWSAGFGSE